MSLHSNPWLGSQLTEPPPHPSFARPRLPHFVGEAKNGERAPEVRS